MYIEELRRAVLATPRHRLAEIQVALWKSHAAGAIGDDDAQAMAEAIQARKLQSAPMPRRHVGSRPASPASIERRRRWTGSGWLPAHLVARFTMAENAVLAVIAAEVAQRGQCRLTVGHIAALAGVGRTSVQNALREAAALGLVTVEQRRQSYSRSQPNVVSIVSREWSAWVRMRGFKIAGTTNSYLHNSLAKPVFVTSGRREVDERNRKARATQDRRSAPWGLAD